MLRHKFGREFIVLLGIGIFDLLQPFMNSTGYIVTWTPINFALLNFALIFYFQLFFPKSCAVLRVRQRPELFNAFQFLIYASLERLERFGKGCLISLLLSNPNLQLYKCKRWNFLSNSLWVVTKKTLFLHDFLDINGSPGMFTLSFAYIFHAA